jgi:hypothetical protein
MISIEERSPSKAISHQLVLAIHNGGGLIIEKKGRKKIENIIIVFMKENEKSSWARM